MEARIRVSGLGMGIPSSSFGVNVVSGAYIEVRGGKSSSRYLYALIDTLSIGNDSSTLGASHILTDWMYIDPKNDHLFKFENLKGLVGEINVSGTVIGSGDVDVKYETIDANGTATTLLDLKSIKTNIGFQVSATKVRAPIRFIKVLTKED